jgi:hypothetical protein
MSPKRERFEPKTMHYTPLLATSTDTSTVFMVIDDITAHLNPKHLCIGMMRKYAIVIDDVTAHVNPKHLYDETMCHSATHSHWSTFTDSIECSITQILRKRRFQHGKTI